MSELADNKQPEKTSKARTKPSRDPVKQKQLVMGRRGTAVNTQTEKEENGLGERTAVYPVSSDMVSRAPAHTKKSRFVHDFSRVTVHTVVPQTRPVVQAKPTINTLDDLRVQTAQCQALAAEVRRVQENGHRPLSRTPLIPEIRKCLPSWMKKRVNQQPALRNVLLILYARIGASLWKYIPEKSITDITLMGVIEFELQDHNALKKTLKDKGYTDAFRAKASNNVWGLRESSDVSVAGLHWRGLQGGRVNVHVDLHPPRWWPGLWHAIRDFILPYKLGIKPTLADVQTGVESLGIEIPVLHQQKVHGKLTVRLNDLESRVKGQLPAAQAEIDEGRGYLRQAASIIWNKDVIEQAELKKAIWYLALAEACASGAEHNLKSKR